MLYLNQELAYHEKLKHEDRREKAICMNKVNYRRKQMGKPRISITTADNNKPASKPRINYWLVKAAQYAWLASEWKGIIRLMEEGGRDKKLGIEHAMVKVDAFTVQERIVKQRVGNPAYPQYTVEV